VIELIKSFSLEPVDPLDFLFADCLERGHSGLSGIEFSIVSKQIGGSGLIEQPS
jgi:hypothetical protein